VHPQLTLQYPIGKVGLDVDVNADVNPAL